MTINASHIKPALYIVMGVSGSGKSTIASLLANKLGCQMIEADDYHSHEAKTLMSKGIGLSETHRAPWIDRLCTAVIDELLTSQQVVMSYSGLKKHHREKIRQLDVNCYFFNIELHYHVVFSRLIKREGHFVDQTLLASQFNDFETPVNEPDVFTINGENSPNLLVDEITNLLSSTV